jgi:hypothetical protein
LGFSCFFIGIKLRQTPCWATLVSPGVTQFGQALHWSDICKGAGVCRRANEATLLRRRRNVAPTCRACGQVGVLKLVCPNVRRYKLLMLSYLQKFKRFPSAETKVHKKSKCSITSVSPHLPQTHVGGSGFSFPLVFIISKLSAL